MLALLSIEPVTGPQWDSWKKEQGLVTDQPITRYTYKYNLPEYSQYKEFIKSVRPTTTPASVLSSEVLETMTTPASMLVSEVLESEHPKINAPTIPLCNQTPESGDIYAHFTCVLTYIFYLLFFATIITYLWRKWNAHFQTRHPQGMEHEGIDMDLLTDTLKANGFPSDNKNTRGKPNDEEIV